jgi:nucleotide-binding universal stress UspA family protein
MRMPDNIYHFRAAIQEFQTARQRASIQEVLARVTGKSNRLLSYDEVAEKLKLRTRSERGIQNIPIDAIVGSVGRYNDFTRTFLPRSNNNQQRWASVKAAMQNGAGLPPVEVYKVGDVYFVVDGNHRVSIARQERVKTIEAHVIEFNTDAQLTPDTKLDDLIVKAEYIEFLEKTGIADSRPNVDLSVTVPGQYGKLMEQIDVCPYLFEDAKHQGAALQDAAAYWYDNLYIPLAEAIRDRGLLRWFPNRTITDLYVWISENRAALEEELGWEIQSEIAATDLILKGSVKSEPGSWRKARTITRYTDRLFSDILVPLSGYVESWDALDQAIAIARRENAKLHGLYITETKDEVEGAVALGIKQRFEQTCKDAGVEGALGIDVGDITQRITERAVATDLIVLKIVNPPSTGLAALASPFRTIIQRSSRPLITVPEKASEFKHALLAFDGSERAKEALFVAAYFAETWKTKLTVFTALEGSKIKADVKDYARRYLELHEVEAEYVLGRQGTNRLCRTAEEFQADLILMGSHEGGVLQQMFTGNTVDRTLRESTIPTFICR